jgi:sec-independent protein translocase protein TatC
MFILKKLFEFRDKSEEHDEKPFLEHLEDLRSVITRVVITLLIAMICCFAFRNQLMTIIRAPVEQVWLLSQESKMPNKETAAVVIDLNTWEMAKRAARDTASFTPEQKKYYLHQLDPDGSKHLTFHTDCVPYYRAALELKKAGEDGEKFIQKLPDLDTDQKKQVLALLDENNQPDAVVDSRGKLVLMQALNPTEGFMLSIKLALYAGVIVSFPLLLYFILQFILPGLKEKEKKTLWPSMIIGFGLFLTGVLFAYFFVLPRVLDFFYHYSQDMGVANEWRIGYYISFSTQFTLIFGLSFELPVVVMGMVKLGVLNYEIMKNTRSHAILAIVIIAAVITPTPDAFTLLLLSGPMILLYEICIWLAFFHNKKEREAELAEKKELENKMIAAPTNTTSRDDDDDNDDDPDNDGGPDDDGGDGGDNDGSGGGKIEPDYEPPRKSYSRDIEEFDDLDDFDEEEYDLHSDQETDHYNHTKGNPFPAGDDEDHEIHDEDEGDEIDDGTYDFTDEELEEEYYSHDTRPIDSYEPSEEHFYDDLDDDFEIIDSDPNTPSTPTSENEDSSQKTEKVEKEKIQKNDPQSDQEDPPSQKDN